MEAVVVESYGGTVLAGHPGGGLVHRGVPPRGPFAVRSASHALALVGGGATVIETAARLAIQIRKPGLVAVVGPGVRVLQNGNELSGSALFWADTGTLTIEGPSQGARAIVATAGSWQCKSPIGNGIGQAIIKGQELISIGPDSSYIAPIIIENIGATSPGSAYVVGLAEAMKLTVQRGSDRRGVRLKGDIPGQNGLPQSIPCVVGTVQLTPDGTMIIIGPDGPTIGGYHQLGVVASCSIEEVAQWRPGDEITLLPATLEECRKLMAAEKAALSRQLLGLRSRL